MTYQIFDPYEGMPHDATVNAEQWLDQQGWSEFLGIGGEQSDLSIRTYRRTVEGQDEYIVQVWDVMQGSPFVKVDNFGELMDLLARWAPAAQAAALVFVIDALQSYDLDREGVVETLAAKAAFGGSKGLEALQRHQQEQDAQRRRVAEQRRAKQATTSEGQGS
ncbi:hypothetical protein ACGFI4_12790 [Micromonospora carbonacea]|uniref:hypothetical protein n=1 Tax=Micromonospora carbonacea TaxID=47853 RepID=UPI00372082EE